MNPISRTEDWRKVLVCFMCVKNTERSTEVKNSNRIFSLRYRLTEEAFNEIASELDKMNPGWQVVITNIIHLEA